MSNRHRPKSPSVQLVLTLLFGPLGLLYSSVPGAVLVSLAAIVFAYDTDSRNVAIGWPVALVTGYFTVRHWNLRAAERGRSKVRTARRPTKRGDEPCSLQET